MNLWAKYRKMPIDKQMITLPLLTIALIYPIVWVLLVKGGLHVTSGYGFATAAMLIILAVALVVELKASGRVLARDFGSMNSFAKSIAEGNLGFEIEATSQNEYGQMLTQFASMQKTLMDMIADVTTIKNSIESGDLTVAPAAQKYKGSYCTLVGSFDSMVAYLTSIVVSLRNMADQISSEAAQISDGSQSLAQGSTEQASAVEEMAATLEGIVRQSHETTENIVAATTVSNQINQKTNTCSEKMQELVDCMSEVSVASKDISNIVKTIDEISFQTNILSLNAAIEAARAGDAGKGFSVVATEVRNLAQKISEATKDIDLLVSTNVEKVNAGTESTTTVQALLSAIQSSMHQSVDELTTAANQVAEQGIAIEQVDQGIGQVSNVVQMNTATAEESAAASEELATQAATLNSMMRNFKIKSKE